MQTNNSFTYLSLTVLLILLAFSCRKKAPDGFSADFDISYNNGGMAPDTLVFDAQFADADSYDWSLEGNPVSGQQVAFLFHSAGYYNASLKVKSGKHSETQNVNFEIKNYPPGGSAMTIIQEDGVIGSFTVDTDDPYFVPIDTVEIGGIGGMDYDDNTKQLYYTGSIKRAFPNGAGKELIFDDLNNGEKIVALEVDSDGQRVYFASVDNGVQTIASIHKDGGDLNEEFIFTGFGNILDISLNRETKRVYFTREFSTSLFYTILGDVATLYSNNDMKSALVFDNSTQWLYYTEYLPDFTGGNPHANILRLQPDIYNPDLPDTWPELVIENASTDTIQGLDISESKQHLYWSDNKDNLIYRLDLNNPEAKREVIFTNVSNPKALAIGNFGD